jgi:large subunit ribosomal protein L10
MNKTERQETVESLSALLKDSPHVYVTDFSGMNVLRMTEFRRRLRAAGVSSVVLTKDPLTAAKVLGDFAREFERPAVKAGLVDGKTVPPAHVKRLGEIPSREVLLAMIAGSFNGLLYSFVGALEALREQRGSAS